MDRVVRGEVVKPELRRADRVQVQRAAAPTSPGSNGASPWRSLISVSTLVVPFVGALVGGLALGADEPELAAISAAVGLGWFGHATTGSGSRRRMEARLAAERCARRGLEDRVAELEGLSALRGLALIGGVELDAEPAAGDAGTDLASWTALLGAEPAPADDLFAQAFGATLDSTQAPAPAEALVSETAPSLDDR